MNLRKTLCLLILICVCNLDHGYAQHTLPDTSVRRDTAAIIKLYFRFDRALLEKEYMTNAEALARMDTLLNTPAIAQNLDSIAIIASASPDGALAHNIKLAKKRAQATRTYVYWKHPGIAREKVRISSNVEDWDGLAKLAAADDRCPYQARILEIIGQDVNPATKEWRLRQARGGEIWQYIVKHYLRYLRAGSTCVILFKTAAPEPAPEPAPIPAPEPVSEPTSAPESEPAAEEPAPQPIVQTPSYVRKPLLAVKTNLLFDLASMLNAEIEVPIGERWSVAGEWMFPWWRSGKSDFTMQVLTGHGEVKYWLGSRAERDVLTGWHLGLYGGGGKYDFQIFNNDGAQGNFFDMGVSVGYAHKISRNFRMEYSLGIGYLRSDYETYDRVRDTQYGDIKVVRYPWETHRLNWFGPTRARISLVWLLQYKRKEAAK